MPISLTGMPSSFAIASAMPPLAVPSSFVRMIPVTPTASPNSFAWRTPFWPVVASTVISVSCGASGICLVITRRTLVSSSIRFVCVCRRPAVSMMITSAPRSRPRAIASKATAPGSEPSGPLTTSTPGALAPALELLDGGGAERVRRADHDRRPSVLRRCHGELADRRRLAGAVDADDEDHGRVGAQVDLVVAGAGELGEQLGEPVRERLAADERALLGLAFELLDDLRGGPRADVGVDQRLLEALPGVLVEVALEQRRLDLGGQRLARLAHVLAQAAEEAAAASPRARARSGACGGRRGRGGRGRTSLWPCGSAGYEA